MAPRFEGGLNDCRCDFEVHPGDVAWPGGLVLAPKSIPDGLATARSSVSVALGGWRSGALGSRLHLMLPFDEPEENTPCTLSYSIRFWYMTDRCFTADT